MSKKTKRLLIILLILLAIPVGACGSIYALYSIHDAQTRHRIADEYSKISLPSYLHLTNKEWTSGGFDNAAEWRYSYSSPQPTETAFTDLITSLNKAGYAVTQAQIPTSNSHPQISYGNSVSILSLNDQENQTSISATKKNLFVHFDFEQNKINSEIYESHNPGDPK